MAELVADMHFRDSAIADQDRYVQSMSRLASGGFIAVGNDQSGGPIFGQIFDARGAEVGNPIQLSATGDQPSVTGLTNGGFALSWRSSATGAVVTRAFDTAGSPMGSETQSPGIYVGSTETIATPGGYVVAWVAGSPGSRVLNLRAFDATGAAHGAPVAIGNRKEAFWLADLDDGRVLIASVSQDGTEPYKINVRVFDAVTRTLSANDLISIVLPSGSIPDSLGVVQLASGKILVSYINIDMNGARELTGAIFSASGLPSGETFKIATGNLHESIPIAALDDGGFIATYNVPGASGGTVVAQLFGDDAKAIGVPFTVSGLNDATPGGAVVAAFGTNDFAIGWSFGSGFAADSAVRSYFSFPGASEFQLNAANGLTASMAGNGSVFGTNGFQDITVLPEPAGLSFDPSFNRGGDIVRLPGNAGQYSVFLSGSSALFVKGDTHVSIPVGTAGMAVVFDDGARNLVFDTSAMVAKIGGQTISKTLAAITAAADVSTLPTGADSAAAGRLIFSAGGEAKIAANVDVFGTNGNEHLIIADGNARLDGSFNRGGDIVTLADSAGSTTAYRSGSSVILTTPHGVLTIPVGTAGLTLDFAGDERVLRFDSASSSVKIGNETISATSVGTAQHLDHGPAAASLAASIDLLASNFTTIA